MQRRHLTSIPVSPGPSAAERIATADGVGPANITVVRTAREFQAAFTSGAQDVQIRGHLDLASLALAFHSRGTQPPTVLGDSSPATRSIRVRVVADAQRTPRAYSLRIASALVLQDRVKNYREGLSALADIVNEQQIWLTHPVAPTSQSFTDPQRCPRACTNASRPACLACPQCGAKGTNTEAGVHACRCTRAAGRAEKLTSTRPHHSCRQESRSAWPARPASRCPCVTATARALHA